MTCFLKIFFPMPAVTIIPCLPFPLLSGFQVTLHINILQMLNNKKQYFIMPAGGHIFLNFYPPPTLSNMIYPHSSLSFCQVNQTMEETKHRLPTLVHGKNNIVVLGIIAQLMNSSPTPSMIYPAAGNYLQYVKEKKVKTEFKEIESVLN